MDQYGNDSQGFGQVVQTGLQLRFLRFVFSQYPRHLFVDILVGSSDENPDFFKSHVKRKSIHLRFHFSGCARGNRLQIFIVLVFAVGLRYDASAVLFDHGRGPGNQIAQVVGQIVIDSLQQHFIGEHAVLAKGIFSEQEILQRVDAVTIDQLYRIHHVAFGFTHLSAFKQKPAVAENLLRKRQI